MQGFCVRCSVVGMMGLGLFVSSHFLGLTGEHIDNGALRGGRSPMAAASAVLSMADHVGTANSKNR